MKNIPLTFVFIFLAVVVVGILWWSPWQAQAPADEQNEMAANTEQEEDTPPFVVDQEEPALDEPAEEEPPSNDEPPQQGEDDEPAPDDPVARVTVTYSGSSFDPATVTINSGDTVVFVNDSSGNFWPASDIHPTHTSYDGTSLNSHCPDPGNTAFDACEGIAPGGTYEFTFNQVGQWRYHDHLRPSADGTIVVE